MISKPHCLCRILKPTPKLEPTPTIELPKQNSILEYTVTNDPALSTKLKLHPPHPPSHHRAPTLPHRTPTPPPLLTPTNPLLTPTNPLLPLPLIQQPLIVAWHRYRARDSRGPRAIVVPVVGAAGERRLRRQVLEAGADDSRLRHRVIGVVVAVRGVSVEGAGFDSSSRRLRPRPLDPATRVLESIGGVAFETSDRTQRAPRQRGTGGLGSFVSHVTASRHRAAFQRTGVVESRRRRLRAECLYSEGALVAGGPMVCYPTIANLVPVFSCKCVPVVRGLGHRS